MTPYLNVCELPHQIDDIIDVLLVFFVDSNVVYVGREGLLQKEGPLQLNDALLDQLDQSVSGVLEERVGVQFLDGLHHLVEEILQLIKRKALLESEVDFQNPSLDAVLED